MFGFRWPTSSSLVRRGRAIPRFVLTVGALGGLLVVAVPASAPAMLAGRARAGTASRLSGTGFARIGRAPSLSVATAMRLGPLPSTQPLQIEVALNPRDPAALARYASEVSTPGSPLYRKYINKGAFARTFGPKTSVIRSVRNHLSALGLRLGPTSGNGLLISIRTTAKVAEAAFRLHLERYRLASSRIAFANTTAPSVPEAIAPYVMGIVGLNNLSRLRPMIAWPKRLVTGASGKQGAEAGGGSMPSNSLSLRPKLAFPVSHSSGPAPCPSAASTASNNSSYTANQIASAYGLTAAYGKGSLGSGETIALYELAPFSVSDIQQYQSCYGTSTTVTPIPVDGGGTPGTGGSAEDTLDIEDAIGLAPQAKINVYEAPNTAVGSVAGYNQIAIDDSAQVVSSSWGTCDAHASSSAVKAENTLFEQMAIQGQTVLVAAGDSGSAACKTTPMTSVSCTGASFCAAVDAFGAFLTWNGTSWSQPSVIDQGGGGLTSVSCVSSSFCMAVDNSGRVLFYPGGALWSAPEPVDLAGGGLTSVSCASTTFCGAVDASGNALIYSIQAGSSTATWSQPYAADPNGGGLTSVSCTSSSFCMAVDMKGDELYYLNGTWSLPASIDPAGNPFSAVSCVSEYFCVAVDSDFIVYMFVNGSEYTAVLTVDSGSPTSATCSSTTFCAIVDAAGNVYTYNGSSWAGPNALDSKAGLSSASCTGSAPFCAAVDVSGNAITENGTGPISGPSVVDDVLSPGSPASDPYVTGVGGTSMTAIGPPPTETVWNDGPGSAGSGGISSSWPMPTWQSNSGVTGVINSYSSGTPCVKSIGTAKYCRQEPDVSAAADPNHGYVIYYKGAWTVIGGTSAAAPTWASLLALVNESCGVKLGFANPLLYQAAKNDPSVFNDLTSGNNDSYGNHGGKYPATRGYDMASGLGTPNGAALQSYVCSHVPVTPPPTGVASGYRFVASDGGIFSFKAPFYGSMGGKPLNAPIVGMAADPATGGYWFVASDGGIFSFKAPFYGSMGGKHLNAPIVGMASTPDGKGYWFVASDGGIFSFGDATFYGSMGGKHLNAPIVGMAADPATGGYWFVASDGGIFSFKAPFYGSMGGKPLNAPIVGMAAAPATGGYWFVASDGGIFSFKAPFYGSMGGKPLNAPIVGMAVS